MMDKRLIAYGLAVILMSLSTCGFTQVLPENKMGCPDKLNCVSSQANTPRHFIKPFTFNEPPAEVMKRLKTALLNEKRVTIVAEQKTYLHAEVRSFLFRFVDDVEFTLLPEEGVIHLHSSSRTGYYDFGVNRRRMERIRQQLQK